MRKYDLTIDVSESVPLPGQTMIAATLFLPDDLPPSARPILLFASPGGGYARGYYDLRFPGHEDYSQAEHHTARGIVLVAFDHLGCGASRSTDLERMSLEMIAAADHAAVSIIMRRLVDGTLVSGLVPILPRVTIGSGQSMGGGMTILMQARHGSFDAIAPLGYSAIQAVLPQRTEEDRARARSAPQFERSTDLSGLSMEEAASFFPDYVYPFHWEDVPQDILQADMAGGFPVRSDPPYWGSATIPNCVVAMTGAGIIRDEAAVIDVPVFFGVGERDVSETPRAEAAAFGRATDFTLFIAPTMAHMHNFASTRRLLWDRLAGWAETLPVVAGNSQ